jgi:hypothetical protein
MTPAEYAKRLRWQATGELLAALTLIGSGTALIAFASLL